ncbi:hypothetical protein AcW1_000488 [Taiwanofungus camphoratus]|nr:hypothetical protein AcW2_001017 [Antrodia cinnamomea]KAI0961405.1 hypothetical protein AcV7_000512 [Antrodia cinnamomea]KAI0963405.1 hypothetical protein AcW1_000488 [Antrodia cinnamomea]
MAGVAAAFKSLSDDNAIQYILADIPFFCMGIMSIGLFIFFVLMRRVDSLVFCLHMSVIVAFVASILDLVQILVRGRFAVDEGLELNSVSGLITSREVGYALSFGLRFLYFWGFVAQPPPGEIPPKGNVIHSGSWRRWGITGVILEWSALTATLAIPVLQILYRNVDVLHKFGPVYIVEGALQIGLSAAFILKIVLNCWARMLANPEAAPARKTILSYSPMISALVLSMWIGIGNIAMFEFTETVLGRFLQAVEFYIVILHVLVTTFYHLRRVTITAVAQAPTVQRNPSFNGLPELKSHDPFMRIAPPVISTPDLRSVIGQNVRTNYNGKGGGRPSLLRQGSAASRISSWLNFRRFSSRAEPSTLPDADNARLWNQDEAERGYSPDGRDIGGGPVDSAIDVESTRSYAKSVTRAESTKWQEPAYVALAVRSPSSASTNALANTALSPSSGQTAALRRNASPSGTPGSRARTPELPKITIPPRAHSRYVADTPHTASPPSIYGSPVSGVNDIIRGVSIYDNRATLQPSPISDYINSSRSSRISDLLRQQAELDRSIAALRIFSPSNESIAPRKSSPPLPFDLPQTDESDQRKTRSSAPSDVSLSNFPDPPWGRTSTATTMTILPAVPLPSDGTSSVPNNIGDDATLLPAPAEPPVMFAVTDGDYASNSRSPTPLVDMEPDVLPNRSRMNSGGTQYEITSFIGKLTHPEHYEPASFSTVSVINSDDGQINVPRNVGSRDDAGTSRVVPATAAGNQNAKEDVVLRQASDDSSVVAGAPPNRTFSAPSENRFVRPVGLPPRPRLVARDLLSPVMERPSP